MILSSFGVIGALTQDNFSSSSDWTVYSSVTINTIGQYAYPTAGTDIALVYHNINSTDDIFFGKLTVTTSGVDYQKFGAMTIIQPENHKEAYIIDIKKLNNDIAITEKDDAGNSIYTAITVISPISDEYCFKIIVNETKGALYYYKTCDVALAITDTGWASLYDSTAGGNNNGRLRGDNQTRAFFGWRLANSDQHADGIAYYSTTPPPPPNNYTFSRNITEQPTSDLAFAVNSTIGFGDEIIWTNPFQPCVEALYYNSSTIFAVGNSSEICNYEIESTGLGNNPTDVYSNDAVAVYHFGINSSTTDDSTSNGNDGTAYNGTEWVTTGKYGGAFEFDGVDDYIDIGTTDFFSDNFTISTWVNFLSLSPIQHILAKGDNDGVSFRTYNDELRIYVGSVLTGKTGAFTINNWYQVVATYNGTNTSLYIDGVNVAEGVIGAINYETYTQTTIGANKDGTANFMNGTIDEVRIYNRSLSPIEIEELYNNSIPGRNMNLDVQEQGVLTMSGYTKDIDGNLKGSSVVIVIDQANPSVVYKNTTSNSTGYWSIDNIQAEKTYVVMGYDPNNSTLDGDAEPHILPGIQ